MGIRIAHTMGDRWISNPNLVLGSDTDPDNPRVTLFDYQQAKTKVKGLVDKIEALRHELTKLVDDKDDAAGELSKLNTRALSAIRGIFGPDSAQYDQAGGVRTSERKKPVRTKKPANS